MHLALNWADQVPITVPTKSWILHNGVNYTVSTRSFQESTFLKEDACSSNLSISAWSPLNSVDAISWNIVTSLQSSKKVIQNNHEHWF
jgi:hypothetical protein